LIVVHDGCFGCQKHTKKFEEVAIHYLMDPRCTFPLFALLAGLQKWLPGRAHQAFHYPLRQYQTDISDFGTTDELLGPELLTKDDTESLSVL